MRWSNVRRVGDDNPSYLVEHLATFGVGPQFGVRWPEDGLRRLKQMERSSAIWAQRMVLRLRRDVISVEDENGEIVEQFPLGLVTEPTAYISQDPRDVYNNLLVFVVKEDTQKRTSLPTEMHIFQVKLVAANEVAEDIRLYLEGRFSQVPTGLHDTGFEPVRREPEPSYPAPRPPVSRSPSRQVFREEQQQRFHRAESSYTARDDYLTSPDHFERDVNTLNRCFDDIERFVARIQTSALAQRDLDVITRQRQTGVRRGRPHADEAALKARAQLPPEAEFVTAFQKFKLCFNLLAKLKNHIHEPNAPELLHFLFTPLVLILDACQWGLGRNVAQNVVNPLITREGKELLLNCLTSKEMEVWMSLGDSWRTPPQDWPYPAPSSFTPTFDGLGSSVRSSPHANGNGVVHIDPIEKRRLEVEKEKLAMKEEALRERERMLDEEKRSLHEMKRQLDEERRSIVSEHPPRLEDGLPSRHHSRSMGDLHREAMRGAEREIPVTVASSQIGSPRHRSYLDELRARRSKAVQVSYDRVGQNSKELTVHKGEYLEVLNDSKKWWECRNASGRVGFVPNTILTVVDPSIVEKSYHNGGVRSTFDQPLFVRPNGTNSDPPSASAAYIHQDRSSSHIRGNSTSPHGNPYAPGGPETPDYLRNRIGRKGEFRYF